MYGDKFIFTANMACDENATEEEMDAIVDNFIKTIGADNRCLTESRGPARFREKIYIASRKNYDRLLDEGKVIF